MNLLDQTRRQFLGTGSLGLGAAAISSLMASAADPLAPRTAPLPAKAKRVIYLHMSGSPPHLDLFDHKPELVKRTGEDVPDSHLKGRRFAFTSGVPKLLGTPRTFAPRGKNGVLMSDAVPRLHDVADEICMIRSMKTDEFNHAPAELLLFTGSARQGRPGMGSWVTYGLGTEN